MINYPIFYVNEMPTKATYPFTELIKATKKWFRFLQKYLPAMKKAKWLFKAYLSTSEVFGY